MKITTLYGALLISTAALLTGCAADTPTPATASADGTQMAAAATKPACHSTEVSTGSNISHRTCDADQVVQTSGTAVIDSVNAHYHAPLSK